MQAVATLARTDLGALIKARRERANLRQEDLARMLHISAESVGAIEQGRTKIPSPAVLKKLPGVLDVSAIEIGIALGLPIETEAGVFGGEPEKAGVLRRLSTLATDQLLRVERMARIAFLESVPPEVQTATEGGDDTASDSPDAEAKRPA